MKRTKSKKVLFFSLLLGLSFLPAGGPGQVPGKKKQESPTVTWTVTVVGARGLRDLDFLPKRGTSDPYVKIIRRTSIFPNGIFKLLFLPVGETPVVDDNTNPTWNYSVKLEQKMDQGAPWLIFRVWDKDPHSSAFLGVAELIPGKSGVYELPLKWNLVGSGRVPGVLTVKIDKSEPVAEVPDVKGLTLQAAGERLHSKGLYLSRSPVYKPIHYSRDRKAKVEAQDPAPGAKVRFRSSVRLVYTLPFTMCMPDLKGDTKARAEERIPEPFRKNLAFRVRRSMEKDTSKWFKVCDQYPRPGKMIDALNSIRVYILEPAEGTKVEVPKVTGKRFREARRILLEHYLRKVRIVAKEHPTLNRVVLSQSPPPGTLYPYDSPAGVTLTVAALADGRSILTAKSLKPGPPFTCFYSGKKRHEFRKIRVEKTGYLVARSLKITRGADVEIRFFSPDFKETGTPPAIRVTPGTWYVDFAARVRGLSRKPAKLQVRFYPEFDPGEPNDTRETARRLEFPAHLTFGICGPRDEDHYRFELKESAYLEVRGGKEVYSEDCPITIWCSLTNQDEETFYSGPLSFLKWLPPGVYDLSFGAESEGFDPKPYTVDIRLQEDLDKTEPNDTQAEATEVHVPAYVATRFETKGSDCFHLVSKEPGFVVVSLAGKELPSAVICGVTDSEGRGILRHGQLPRALRIDKDAYVDLGLECDRDDERRAPVVLHFDFIPLKKDPLEPNDSLSKARPVPTDTLLKALLLPAEDEDFYRFTLDKDQEVTIELLQSPKEHFTCVGHLFDAGGKEITERQFYPPYKRKLTKGTYIVKLEMEGGMKFLQTEPYVFRIRTALGTAARAKAVKKLEDRYRTGDGREKSKAVEDALALAARAYILLQKGRPAEALALYTKAARIIPGSPAVWNDMGVCCYKLKKIPTAEKLFKKALSLKKSYTLALRNLGVLAGKRGDAAGAVAWCAKAAETDPSAENLSFLGHFQLVAAASSKDREKKKTLLLQALENLKKSYALKKDPKVERQIRLIRKALGPSRKK